MMTSIRGWNGSAWVAPKYCTKAAGMTGTDTWEPYRPAVPGVIPYVWDHSSAQGWTQAVSGGVAPATSTGAEMVLTAPYPGSPYALSCYSPTLDYPGTPWDGLQFAAQVRGECWAMPTEMLVYVQIEHPNGGLLDFAQGQLHFSGSFGHTWVSSGVLNKWNPTEPLRCTIWVSAVDITNVPDYGFTVYVDNSEVQDSAGNRLVVGYDPGLIPKYWNGSSWVAQNSA